MNILKEIIEYKKQVVREAKELIPVKKLEKSIFFDAKCVSMSQYLKRPDKAGVIAEIKRSSPSTGFLKQHIDVRELSVGYMQNGATALSVLTDEKFFKGSLDDLEIARKYNYCPILRKDFIIDEYQILESKSHGADCILLIAACLTAQEIDDLAALAHSHSMEVLLEAHNMEEIEKCNFTHIDIIGVNNRDLSNFTTDIQKSLDLYASLPEDLVKISESGIKSAEDMLILKEKGYDGFLIGGHFMKHAEPAKTCRNMIRNFNKLSQ